MRPTKFWRFANMEAGAKERPTLYIEGYIYPETPWWLEDGTICAPDSFRRQLNDLEGEDIDVYVNSRGGDAAAGVAMFTYLRQRKGTNTFYVPALSASAATLPLMAPGKVYISPAGMLMIHNPSVFAEGDHVDLARAQSYLANLKEAVLAAYVEGTGKSKDEISAAMDAETWYTAQGAIDAGYADEIMPMTKDGQGGEMSYTRGGIMQATMDATRRMMDARLSQAEQDKRAEILRYLETY